MERRSFLQAVETLCGSYNPQDPTTKPRGAMTTFYLEKGIPVPIWLDPSTLIDTLKERKMEQEDSFYEQVKAYWAHRKAIALDKERVRKEFKTLIKNMGKHTESAGLQVDQIHYRISENLRTLTNELKASKTEERQSFLKRMLAEYRPLTEEANAIISHSKQFEQDARMREKLFKAAMVHSLFDKPTIEACLQSIPLLRKGVIEPRIQTLNHSIDQLMEEAASQGEVFKIAEEYEPALETMVVGLKQTLSHSPQYLTSLEPQKIQKIILELEELIGELKELKELYAAPENLQGSPEVEGERRLQIKELVERAENLMDEVIKQELNVAHLSRVERRDRLEAIAEVRRQMISAICLALNTQEAVSQLDPKEVCAEQSNLSTGCLAIDEQRHLEQKEMIRHYSAIQKQMGLAIQYGGKIAQITQEALEQLPPQATAHEKSLLKLVIKELATQAQLEAAQAQRIRETATDRFKKSKSRVNLNKVKRFVDVWQKSPDLSALQKRQSAFFDSLLSKGVKYKNIWVERRKEIGMQEAGPFSDFKQRVLAKEGYAIPGIDTEQGKIKNQEGSKDRVQELLGMYPKLFDDCIEYVTKRVDVEEMPKGLQNEYLGLLVTYLLEQNTTQSPQK